ncbi:MAG: c-type cytochrome [Bryobacteraceae bacterium]|nr:c-type cytochrome [Bryobacteraceae bacterium]
MRALLLFACLAAFAQDDARDFDNITLPASTADLERGRKLYLGSCTYCHGPTGDGGKGADLSRKDLVRAKTDGDLARIIEKGVPGTEMPGAWHMTRREVTQVAAFVRSLAKVDVRAVAGDPVKGQALFQKHGCAGCHTIKLGGSYTGGYMGPDLSSIGLKRSAAHLREALVDPAASLPDGFVPTRLVTTSGRTIDGRRLHEDTFAIVVRDLAGNNHSFLKKDLKSITPDPRTSPMPSYQAKLSAAELDDLIAYLVSLKEPS